MEDSTSAGSYQVGKEETEKQISIHVTSAGYQAGNFATILVDQEPVKVAMNEDGHMRGLHLVVINPTHGNVLSA